MKYNDNGTIKEISVKAVNTNIKNEKSTSKQDTYSCDYINNNVGVVESGSNKNGSYIKYEDGNRKRIKKMERRVKYEIIK